MIFVSGPEETAHFELAADATYLTVKEAIGRLYGLSTDDIVVSTHGGTFASNTAIISSSDDGTSEAVDRWLSWRVRVLGGKGGFGKNLRSQGGRMASRQTTNFDACRDLSGRRLRSVNEAQAIVNHIEHDALRKKAKEEKIQKKIKEGFDAAQPRKVLFNDPAFFKQKEHIIDTVRTAVAIATSSNNNDSASETKMSASASTEVEVKSNNNATLQQKSAFAMWEEEDDASSSDDNSNAS